MILIVDSDEVFARCTERTLKKNNFATKIFGNAIEAMNFIAELENADQKIKMILMDVMLTGPDGFTFLNEMASYADTGKIPILIVSEKDFEEVDLKDYAVVGSLNKKTMKPENLIEYVREYAK